MNSPRHNCIAIADFALGETIAAGSLTSLGDPAAHFRNCLGRRAQPSGRAAHCNNRRSVFFMFRPAAPNREVN